MRGPHGEKENEQADDPQSSLDRTCDQPITEQGQAVESVGGGNGDGEARSTEASAEKVDHGEAIIGQQAHDAHESAGHGRTQGQQGEHAQGREASREGRTFALVAGGSVGAAVGVQGAIAALVVASARPIMPVQRAVVNREERVFDRTEGKVPKGFHYVPHDTGNLGGAAHRRLAQRKRLEEKRARKAARCNNSGGS